MKKVTSDVYSSNFNKIVTRCFELNGCPGLYWTGKKACSSAFINKVCHFVWYDSKSFGLFKGVYKNSTFQHTLTVSHFSPGTEFRKKQSFKNWKKGSPCFFLLLKDCFFLNSDWNETEMLEFFCTPFIASRLLPTLA